MSHFYSRAKHVNILRGQRTGGFTLDPLNTFLIVLKQDQPNPSQCINETDPILVHNVVMTYICVILFE